MKRPLNTGAGLLLALALLLGVNLAARSLVGSAPLDLTEDGLYTLSDGSRSVLKSLRNDLKLEFYYSAQAGRKLTQIASYAQRVSGLLERYRVASGGRVTVETFDPRPDTEREEEALKLGLHAIESPSREPVYFGIAITGEGGRTEVIPFLNPVREPFLEYDLTRLIATVAGPARRTVGIASSLDVEGNPGMPMMGIPPSQGWTLADELRTRFNLRHVILEEGVPEGIDLLVLLHPKALSPKALYSVDQYVMAGGPLFVAVDPLALSDTQGNQGGAPSSDLGSLLKAWGATYSGARIAADSSLATGVYLGGNPIRHPAFLTLGPGNMNPEAVETSNLEHLLFALSGSIELASAPPAGVASTWLLRTGDAPGSLDSIMMRDLADPTGAFASLENLDKPQNLMVRLTGRFPSAFGEAPPQGITPPAGGHRSVSVKETAVVAAADADWLADDFSVQRQRLLGETVILPMNDNLTLAVNVAESLAGAPELMALRARSRSDRPFTMVDKLSAEAAKKYRGVEEGLLARQDEVNRKLAQLSPPKGQVGPALNEAQAEEVRKFREELAETKRLLREVRLDLRSGIEELGFRVKFLNVLFVPALVLAAGFVPVLRRSLRARKG